MKANELRIGNWMQWDSCVPSQFELADFVDWYNDHNSHEFGDHLYPIPLTEEWLLKFGFEKHPIEDRYTSLGFCGLELVTKTGIDYFVVKSIRGDVISFIKYVHQIQNLYFALSGEELAIR